MFLVFFMWHLHQPCIVHMATASLQDPSEELTSFVNFETIASFVYAGLALICFFINLANDHDRTGKAGAESKKGCIDGETHLDNREFVH